LTIFTATNTSNGVVAADRSAIWRLLTDPAKLAEMTPLLDHIEADGDRWRWVMTRIPILGISIAPAFTERMIFTPEERIAFTHAPPDGKPERASAEGTYHLTEVEGGTHLAIDLKLCVELPLPRMAKRAVDGVMDKVMAHMGDRFAANLDRELGLAPAR
jgi:carbon monoxide dehydrogenase subunit G